MQMINFRGNVNSISCPICLSVWPPGHRGVLIVKPWMVIYIWLYEIHGNLFILLTTLLMTLKWWNLCFPVSAFRTNSPFLFVWDESFLCWSSTQSAAGCLPLGLSSPGLTALYLSLESCTQLQPGTPWWWPGMEETSLNCFLCVGFTFLVLNCLWSFLKCCILNTWTEIQCRCACWMYTNLSRAISSVVLPLVVEPVYNGSCILEVLSFYKGQKRIGRSL